jgi:4'-phosphopantetheinyl transferase
MNSVRLYYIKLTGEDNLDQLDPLKIERWISSVSTEKQAIIQRLLHLKSQVSSLAGLHLLNLCAKEEGVTGFDLSEVQYPKSGKPFWDKGASNFDFNVSHSGDFILVAASTSLSVGIDVEKIKELKRLNFKMVMSSQELEQIKKTPLLFFDLWSKKEAVVKAADTVGLARMSHVKLKSQSAELDEKEWYLKKVNLDEAYMINLATSEPVDELIIKQIDLAELD